MEGLSPKSGRLVTERWKVCHRKVEGLSLKSGGFVTEKWKVCHYGGRFVTTFLKIAFLINKIFKNQTFKLLISVVF